MNISFKNSKLDKIFNSEKELVRTYGKDRAKYIQIRMSKLEAADNLDQIPKEPPERCHQLMGNRDEQFAVDLPQPWRLIFEVNNKPIPRKDDQGIDLKRVTEIKIIEVENYHHGR
jgi:proteic killer suppression protein